LSLSENPLSPKKRLRDDKLFPMLKPRSQNLFLAWVFATKEISKVEGNFRRRAIEGHRTHPGGSDLKWKQVGVDEITDSPELSFSIKGLTADHPSQDGKAVFAVVKVATADSDRLSDSCQSNFTRPLGVVRLTAMIP
jgi:hypothetical protein